MKAMKRITLKSGREVRKLTVVAPPFPEVGDVLMNLGKAWEVTGVRDVDGLILPTFGRTGQTRQCAK